jgi:adenylate cyclase
LANSIGALVVFLTFGLAPGPRTDISRGRFPELLALFVGTLLVTIPPVVVFLTRSARPYISALEQNRPLVGEVRRVLLRAPRLNATASFAVWGLAAAVFPVHAVARLASDIPGAIALSLSILIGGLATVAVVYLLNERLMRPAFAYAFREQPPDDVEGVAVGQRLVLSWFLGAGLPLVAIAIMLLDPENARVDFASVQRVALILVGVALFAGAVITRRVARSVAEPLGSVREAMARVTAGHLDASVEVNDATEVGLLQAGFNEMVSGLQERERMRDLFGRHVGEDVARNALERGVELGGELREASAVFIDLTGSTKLTSSLPPAEVVEMLNHFFRAVVSATESEGGWVNKFEGDAALCVFGVPVTDPNHAAHALRAARALRVAMVGVRGKHPELDAGIGISMGTVLAGNVGAEHRYEYTVIGDAVNEAARLVDEAKSRNGRVLASEAVVLAAGADERRRWRECGEIELRGLPQPTRVYEPV